MKVAALFAVVLSSLAFAPAARAQDPGGGSAFAPPMAASRGNFGGVGQWVLSMQTGPGGSGFFFHRPSGGDWEIKIHPALDYFLTNNISVGGVVGISYSPAANGTTNLDLGARAGYYLNIADRIGFWPSAGLSVNVNASNNHDTTSSSALNVFAPFLYHPVPHFFVGLGPSFQLGLSGDWNVFGLDFVIGGWL